jgi:hypothetical protein
VTACRDSVAVTRVWVRLLEGLLSSRRAVGRADPARAQGDKGQEDAGVSRQGASEISNPFALHLELCSGSAHSDHRGASSLHSGPGLPPLPRGL